MSRRAIGLGAIGSVVVAILATAILAWWAIGDLTDTDPSTADYLFRPPSIPSNTQQLIVAAAALALLLAMIALVFAWRALHPALEWIIVIGLWLAAASALGGLERVVTVGVIGANIGGGLALMATPIAAIGLLGATMFVAIAIRRRSREQRTG